MPRVKDPGGGDYPWIDDIEFEDAQIKWPWSHFDGRDTFGGGEGSYNFTIILPEKTALALREAGWTSVKENEGYEEGDPPEWTMQAKISDRFELPKMYLIKNGRRFRVHELRDLHDIRRDTCDQIDVILTPSRWVNGNRTGITAYVKELYATIRQSRFADKYEDLEEV
jgi:hypothetical protein